MNRPGDDLEHAGAQDRQDRIEEFLLRGEMQVEGAVSDFRPGGDSGDRAAGIAVFTDDPTGRLKQVLARFLVPLNLGCRPFPLPRRRGARSGRHPLRQAAHILAERHFVSGWKGVSIRASMQAAPRANRVHTPDVETPGPQ
jgi:hypothetical protein